MKTISIDVPDRLADRIESASGREKLVWAFRLASLVEEDAPSSELRSILGEIESWQAKNGVSGNDFESLFADLAAED